METIDHIDIVRGGPVGKSNPNVKSKAPGGTGINRSGKKGGGNKGVSGPKKGAGKAAGGKC